MPLFLAPALSQAEYRYLTSLGRRLRSSRVIYDHPLWKTDSFGGIEWNLLKKAVLLDPQQRRLGHTLR
jgi:hypothetical protein